MSATGGEADEMQGRQMRGLSPPHTRDYATGTHNLRTLDLVGLGTPHACPPQTRSSLTESLHGASRPGAPSARRMSAPNAGPSSPTGAGLAVGRSSSAGTHDAPYATGSGSETHRRPDPGASRDSARDPGYQPMHATGSVSIDPMPASDHTVGHENNVIPAGRSNLQATAPRRAKVSFKTWAQVGLHVSLLYTSLVLCSY